MVITDLKRTRIERNENSQEKKNRTKILPENIVVKLDQRLNTSGFNKELRPRFNKSIV